MKFLIKTYPILIYTFSGISLLSTTTLATENTQPDHYKQNCIACHARMTGGEGEVLYQRKERLVNHYNALLDRVEYCRIGVGADWKKMQIDQVVNYLNKSFYHFSTP